MNSFGKSSKTKLASTKVFVRKAQQLLNKRKVNKYKFVYEKNLFFYFFIYVIFKKV